MRAENDKTHDTAGRKKEGGFILLYFLVMTALIAAAGTVVMRFNAAIAQKQLRGAYINGVIGECRVNLANARAAEAEYGDWGMQPEGGIIKLRLGAFKEFLKIEKKMFVFSRENIIKWVKYEKKLEELGVMKNGAIVFDEIDVSSVEDVCAVFFEIRAFMLAAKGQGNNFNYR